jgi:hypothetical protein
MLKRKPINWLSTLIVITVALAPFLDAVACADCHFFWPPKNSAGSYLTTATIYHKAISHYDFTAYTNASSNRSAERGDIPCPFCIFNTFGVISNSPLDFISFPTFFLVQQEPLALLEPIFLKIKPPRTAS